MYIILNGKRWMIESDPVSQEIIAAAVKSKIPMAFITFIERKMVDIKVSRSFNSLSILITFENKRDAVISLKLEKERYYEIIDQFAQDAKISKLIEEISFE